MIVIRPGDPLPEGWSHSIFLAGPTPRSPDVASWRPTALEILEGLDYDGVVFLPEPLGAAWPSYDVQFAWERDMLDACDVILFWIPRDMKTLPGLTTNVEFGLYLRSGKVVAGSPPGADSTNYLMASLNRDTGSKDWHKDLRDLLVAATRTHQNTTKKYGGDRMVPNNIWCTPNFQKWREECIQAGNTLLGARTLWVYPVSTELPFSYAIMVKVHVAADDSVVENEFVLARTSLATVIPYYIEYFPHYMEHLKPIVHVVMVEEFRSCCTTGKGVVLEFPGGSIDEGSPVENAARELLEETKLDIEVERFVPVAERQVMSTFSSHTDTVYSVLLSGHEFREMVRLDALQELLVSDSGENIRIKVVKSDDLFSGNRADWRTIGILAQFMSTITAEYVLAET